MPNTFSVNPDPIHGSRLVRLQRTEDGCWCTCEWSAFLLHLLMPSCGFRCYLQSGLAIAELTVAGLAELDFRVGRIARNEQEIVFEMPWMPVSEETFISWKSGLPDSVGE